MNSFSGVRKWLWVVMVLALCAAQAASAAPRGLSATIDAEKSFLGDTDGAVVRVTLHNDAAEDLYVVYWQTAVRGVEDDIFDVRRNGKPVAYIGRHYKWATPQAEDYVRIPAGSFVAAEVDLTAYYDMSRTGEYSIQYRASVENALSGVGTNIAAARGGEIESNAVHLAVERSERGRLLDQFNQVGFGQETVKALSPGFVGCTTSRQSTLNTALTNAESISLKSINYLNNVPVVSRPNDAAYRTWFGSYTSGRYSTVQSHFTAIHSAFATKAVNFHCDCTSSAYAYVYTNQPYNIHLCNAFWNAPASGIDSTAGTLVHEMSHFTVVAGTSDYAYGTSACQRLATSNPKKAINNADSHEYFAETR